MESEIPIGKIDPNPFQYRQSTKEGISSLAESIKLLGVLEPILVRPSGDRFQVAFGERRWRAAHEAGLASIPATVKELSDFDMKVTSLTENVSREDAEDTEIETGVLALREAGLTQEEIARRCGKAQSWAYHYLTAAELRRTDKIEKSTPSSWIYVARHIDPKERKELLTHARRNKFQVQEVEVAVAKLRKPRVRYGRRGPTIEKPVGEISAHGLRVGVWTRYILHRIRQAGELIGALKTDERRELYDDAKIISQEINTLLSILKKHPDYNIAWESKDERDPEPQNTTMETEAPQ